VKYIKPKRRVVPGLFPKDPPKAPMQDQPVQKKKTPIDDEQKT